MAGIIKISEKQFWSTANWAYWGLMDHLIDALANDTDAARRVEGCKWMQILSIPLLRKDDPKLADRILAKLKDVSAIGASGALVCKVEGRVLDSASQKMFRDTIKVLSDMLE
jgi:hypothetical protein